MGSPKIETFRKVSPYIYSWRTPDIHKYDGWEKVGYTEQESADVRIAQQASQLNIKKIKVWSFRAEFMTEGGGTFRDSDFHAYLKQRGIPREYDPESSPHRTEWHKFAGAEQTSRDYFFDFASKKFVAPNVESKDDYRLRPEQQAAVAQAVTALWAGAGEVLWNAKPRFGKTLTAYQLMREMDVRRALIVTNRPAIANSWFDDFQQFIGHETSFQFVSESPSLSGRAPMTREQWRVYSEENIDNDPRIIEFVSMQDLADTIKAGIAVTYRDSESKLGPIGFFTGHPELNAILHKVRESGTAFIETLGVTSSRSYRYTDKLYEDHPEAIALRPAGNTALINTNAFEMFSFLYNDEKPSDGKAYAQVLGVIKNERAARWIRSDYITGPDSFERYKVSVPAANGSGSTTDFFGVALNNPAVVRPGVGVTQTFITIGSFETEAEAQACLKYLKSKFARTMLGVLKVTQHNPRSTWKFVPAQNFTSASDLDWAKSISELDDQLYAKYGLDSEEIAFIEANVKAME